MGEKAFHPKGVPYQRASGTKAAVGVMVLLLHGMIIIAWLSQRIPQVLYSPVYITLNLLPHELPSPQPPPLDDTPKKQRPREPAARRIELPTLPAKIFVPPVPTAIHRPDEQEWVTPARQVDAGPIVRRAPSEYAHQVQSRVVSQVIYPRNALYPAPPGFRGDPRVLMRECTVAYELVVDRQGRIVSYDLDSCQDELLTPAAEAAILKAQPYPPPPEGAEQYRIYGHINFKNPKLGP